MIRVRKKKKKKRETREGIYKERLTCANRLDPDPIKKNVLTGGYLYTRRPSQGKGDESILSVL